MVNGGMVEVKGGGALNPKFFHLPEERQDLIRNSAMLEFGNNTFKKTSADSIAKRAGVSKGLLFHYFKDKRERRACAGAIMPSCSPAGPIRRISLSPILSFSSCTCLLMVKAPPS